MANAVVEAHGGTPIVVEFTDEPAPEERPQRHQYNNRNQKGYGQRREPRPRNNREERAPRAPKPEVKAEAKTPKAEVKAEANAEVKKTEE